MVDRAAPWVVGAALSGGPYDVLHDLARSPDPLRRSTAITAPLWFVRRGADADLAEGFRLAARLPSDPEPMVTNAVGIFLSHAGERDPAALKRKLSCEVLLTREAATRRGACRQSRVTTCSADSPVGGSTTTPSTE